MVQLTNLARAYDVLAQLAEAAKAHGFKDYTSIIDPSDSEVFFKITDTCAEIGRSFLRGMETDDPGTFNEKAETFRSYWLGLMEKEEASHAARIAELKAELAKLEGRA